MTRRPHRSPAAAAPSRPHIALIFGCALIVAALMFGVGERDAIGDLRGDAPAAGGIAQRGSSGGTEGDPKGGVKPFEQPQWRASKARGRPYSEGRLIKGVRLPSEGRHFFSWNPVDLRRPNPAFRRWGTDVLIRRVLVVLRGLRRDFPDAPRIGIADLSLRRGGEFGPEYGGLGHGSHQNGLDVDIQYPRLDRKERGPRKVEQIDLELAQELVDRLVAARAKYVFVGPNTGLKGPRKVVQPLVHHDDHLHLRIRNTTRKR